MFVRCQSLSSAAAADAAAAISTDDDWHAGVGGGGGTGITTKVSGQIFEFVRWPSVCVSVSLLVCFTVCLCSPRCVCFSCCWCLLFRRANVWTLLLYYDYTHSLTLFRGVFSFEVSKFSRATSANEEKVLEKVVVMLTSCWSDVGKWEKAIIIWHIPKETKTTAKEDSSKFRPIAVN